MKIYWGADVFFIPVIWIQFSPASVFRVGDINNFTGFTQVMEFLLYHGLIVGFPGLENHENVLLVKEENRSFPKWKFRGKKVSISVL